MQRPLLVFSCALAAVTLACKDSTTPAVSKTIIFTGNLTAAAEIVTPPAPPITSPGSGSFRITLDTSTNVLTWDVQVNGLTTNINNGHIHGPASASGNASVILDFAPGNTLIPAHTFTGFGSANSGRAQGSVTLGSGILRTGGTVNGDSLKKLLLLGGQTYVNVHTMQNGGGEVRGQIVKP